MRNVFVTGIGTGVGKTVVAAALARHLKADYWKPIQCGDLDRTDSMSVREWIGLSGIIHPEQFRLSLPKSPHAAAAAVDVTIDLNDFILPSTPRGLIVEGAGGLLVPLNLKDTMADLILHLSLPVVVVVRHYLGSINHTLLTCSVLRAKGIAVEGLIFNGNPDPYSEEAIMALCGLPVIGRVPELKVGDLPIFVPHST